MRLQLSEQCGCDAVLRSCGKAMRNDGTTNSTKIDEWNNPADAFTKVLTSEVFHRHMHHA